MITKQRSLFFYVGDMPFKTLEEAQKHDLKEILKPSDFTDEQFERIADFMLKNAAAIVDCLTTTPTSRIKARKTNGGSKKSPKRQKLQPANVTES